MAKHFALILDGHVVNVYRDLPDSVTPEDVSPVNAPNLIECSRETEAGWRVEAGALVAPPVKQQTVRHKRRAEYRQVLRREEGDDETDILGDTLDVLLSQVEAIRQRSGEAMTQDYADLVGKVATVKAKIPKKP
jgi:hypothetical protein